MAQSDNATEPYPGRPGRPRAGSGPDSNGDGTLARAELTAGLRPGGSLITTRVVFRLTAGAPPPRTAPPRPVLTAEPRTAGGVNIHSIVFVECFNRPP